MKHESTVTRNPQQSGTLPQKHAANAARGVDFPAPTVSTAANAQQFSKESFHGRQ
jgi:hypothetical protein